MTTHNKQQLVVPHRTPEHNEALSDNTQHTTHNTQHTAHSSFVPLTPAWFSLLELPRLGNTYLRVALRLREFHSSALVSNSWVGVQNLGAIVVQCNIWRLALWVLQGELWTLECNVMVTTVNFLPRLFCFINHLRLMWQCVTVTDELAKRLACIVGRRSLETMCCYLFL